MRYFLIILWLCLISCSASDTCYASADEEVGEATEWILWISGTKARRDYEIAITQLVLEQSVDRYGPFSLIINDEQYTALRSNQELKKGKYHFTVSGDWINLEQQSQDYIRVPIPLWEGLQGYRQLMVEESRLPQLQTISSIDDLKLFTVGLGENWTEVLIFQDNDLPVVTALNITSLFKMLSRNRYDYLPLGINEMSGSLRQASKNHDNLAVVPDILLHYPLNIYFQVGKANPQLAERLEYGLRKVMNTELWEATVRDYLSPIRAVKDNSSKIIKLVNRRTN